MSKIGIPLDNLSAPAYTRVNSELEQQTGNNFATSARTQHDETVSSWVQGEAGGVLIVSQDGNNLVRLNDKLIKDRQVNEPLPKVDGVEVANFPDFTVKPWLHTEQKTTVARPRPTEGRADNFTPKPYGDPFPYVAPVVPGYPTIARYWRAKNNQGAISWHESEGVVYYKGQALNLGDFTILAAVPKGSGFYVLALMLPDLQTTQFKYDEYNNGGVGTAIEKTTKTTSSYDTNLKLAADRTKKLLLVTFNNDTEQYEQEIVKDEVIPKALELLHVAFISPNAFVYTALTDAETRVTKAVYDSNLQDWVYTLLYTLPSMEIEDSLTSSRFLKKFTNGNNTSLNDYTYSSTAIGNTRHAVDHQLVTIEGKRVLAVNNDAKQIVLLVEDYSSRELLDVNYPLAPYSVQILEYKYPIRVGAFIAGFQRTTRFNYTGHSTYGTYTSEYDRDTHYTRVIIDIEKGTNTEVPAALPNGKVRIAEASSTLLQSYALVLESNGIPWEVQLAGINFGDTGSYEQQEVKRTEVIEDVIRLYAADPLTDTYLYSVSNVDTDVNTVITDGTHVPGEFPAHDDKVLADREDVTFTAKFTTKFTTKDLLDITYDQGERAKVFGNNRVHRRFLGDPVDYLPVIVPYGFFNGTGWSYRTNDGAPLSTFNKNFSRNYAKFGLMQASDGKRLATTTNLDGRDCLPLPEVTTILINPDGSTTETGNYAPLSLVQQ